MTEQARQKLKEMMKYRIIYPDGCKQDEDDQPELTDDTGAVDFY